MSRSTFTSLHCRNVLPILSVLMLSSVTACAAPSAPVQYRVSLPEPQTQMVDVALRLDEINAPVVELILPTWRPGRYLILDPAGTVQDVRAVALDRDGTEQSELPISKSDKSTWRVETLGFDSILVEYRIYANSIADRTRHVDDTHAFLSGSSVFMYAPERRDQPVAVSIHAPAGWDIASGLEFAPGQPGTLVAPNYDVLVDSPIEVGLHDRIGLEVRGVPHEIVIWPKGLRYDAERLRADFATIVESCVAIFGEFPYTRYVFLIHGGAGGGGTEHLNSTVMQTSRESLRQSLHEGEKYKRFLSLVTHEFFHTWNVKQLRPAGIHPYDYQKENYSKLFWVAEGTTSYYDELLLARTGLVSEKKYLQTLGSSIDSLRNLPGASVQSLEESSFDAWIKFNRPTPHAHNATVSFYSKGAMVSLLLDLEVRGRTANAVSLDDVMRVMYERFPLSGPGYTTADLLGILEELTRSDFDEFFAKYVQGTADLPLEHALTTVGLEVFLKPSQRDGDEEPETEEGDAGEGQEPGSEDGRDDADEAEEPNAPELVAWLGMSLSDTNGRTHVSKVRSDGPAYRAGVLPGDEVVALDGLRLAAGDLSDRLRVYEPDQTVTLHVLRRDALRAIEITLGEKLDAKWSVRRMEDPTPAQKAAFESWIGLPWDSQ